MLVQVFDVQKPFGTAVRAWRNRLGISQEELAGRAGLHRTYVCDVERGARNVTLRSIEKLAQALEISVSTLLDYEKEPAGESRPAKDLPREEMADILLVDNDPEAAELARERLKHIADRIHVVRDGGAALELLFAAGGQSPRKNTKRPQLVLLDLALPKSKGFEVLRRLKADPRTSGIPVIILTASAGRGDPR